MEVFPEYSDGLEGIEEFSHIFLLYEFHKLETNFLLRVKPFLDDEEHGIFATRYPNRPNPIGFSVVGLEKRADNLLKVSGVDMLDGTPLLDKKPYIPDFDVFVAEKTGRYQRRKKE